MDSAPNVRWWASNWWLPDWNPRNPKTFVRKTTMHIMWVTYYYVRLVVKWFLRRTTQMCELQRICYGEPSGAKRVLAVERSLRLSKDPSIKALVAHLDDLADQDVINTKTERGILEKAIRTILRAKHINPLAHPEFAKLFGKCVELIWGYRQLCVECELLRRISYDSENPEHERQLLRLWKLLMPYDDLKSRVSKQWQDIGFQGDDPKTDFRGMGLLGLENLVYFAQEYPSAASHVLSNANYSGCYFPFAIVGINLTNMALKLLRNGAARPHFYNACKSLPTIRAFHQFYSYLFYEFDAFWMATGPHDMMAFSIIEAEFETTIRCHLENPTTVFRINLSVDNI